MATLHEAGTDGARNAAGHTIYAAVEVSRKSWTVALHAPDAGRIGLHTVPAADTAALARLMDRARDALERRHGLRPRVLCGYEAGYEGFWLARRLARLGVEPLVLDPASLPASRKARRPKTDRLDAAGMVRALMAFDRGEPLACNDLLQPVIPAKAGMTKTGGTPAFPGTPCSRRCPAAGCYGPHPRERFDRHGGA